MVEHAANVSSASVFLHNFFFPLSEPTHKNYVALTCFPTDRERSKSKGNYEAPPCTHFAFEFELHVHIES